MLQKMAFKNIIREKIIGDSMATEQELGFYSNTLHEIYAYLTFECLKFKFTACVGSPVSNIME